MANYNFGFPRPSTISEKFDLLNQTTVAISKASAELVVLQRMVLVEGTRQTAILNTQLQIAKINELEKNRQNQVKQAAFALLKRLEEISKMNSVVLKHLYFLEESNQVKLVGLTAEVPNEINDKQYVHDVLFELERLILENNSLLSNDEINEINSYLSNIIELNNSIKIRNNLLKKELPKNTSSIFWGWLKKVFSPNFNNNKNLNAIFIVLYYIYFIPFMLAYIILILIIIEFIIGMTIKIVFYKKNKIKLMNLNASKKIELDNLNLKISELENSINLFKNKYQFN